MFGNDNRTQLEHRAHANLGARWFETEVLRVNGESDLNRSFTETDISSPLQFFDLRVATACEVQSEDEYPPTYP